MEQHRLGRRQRDAEQGLRVIELPLRNAQTVKVVAVHSVAALIGRASQNFSTRLRRSPQHECEVDRYILRGSHADVGYLTQAAVSPGISDL